MEKEERILYCYSQEMFDDLMASLGWKEKPIDKFSTISICSKWNEDFDHWFKDGTEGNFNLDCDDVVKPFWWDKDYYDEALDLYLHNRFIEADSFFNYKGKDYSGHDYDLRLLNYSQAFKLVKWIDERIKEHGNFYVHCAAGLSRSQAVVRYILDTYNEYHWKIRQANPPLYPNNHMLLMLKRAARNLEIL